MKDMSQKKQKEQSRMAQDNSREAADSCDLTVSHVSRRYGAVQALDNISCVIGQGQITMICGSTGSGKTTLLRILAGLETQDTGEVSHLPARRSVTFQDGRLLEKQTVLQNVMYGLDARLYPAPLRRKMALEAMDLCGCPPAGQLAGTLSGGQQQRTALARAVVSAPQLLLLDESFSSLDSRSRSQLQDILLSLQSRLHMTVVFVTHDLQEARKLGDRMILLHNGRCLCQGDMDDLLNREDVKRHFDGG